MDNKSFIVPKSQGKSNDKVMKESFKGIFDSPWSEEAQEKFSCECIKCGTKVTSDKHCVDIKCSKCGGQMRRSGRPGQGR